MQRPSMLHVLELAPVLKTSIVLRINHLLRVKYELFTHGQWSYSEPSGTCSEFLTYM